MLQVKTKLNEERDSAPQVKSMSTPVALHDLSNNVGLSTQINTSIRPAPPRKVKHPTFPAPRVADTRDTQIRVPAIIGDATFRGLIAVDGIISGQPAAKSGGTLIIRQRSRSSLGAIAELDGELRFTDTIRVSKRIGGSIYSEKGTLIVDTSAVVDADVEVGIAVVSGTVNGDIVAYQRVELGPTARIYGNIWTRSLAIQNGAIFEGVCQMIQNTDQGK